MTFLTKLKEKVKECEGWHEMEVEIESISKLIELLEEAVKVIDFYGDPLTYVSNSGKVGITPIYTNDCEDIKGTTGAFRFCGGKRAREFLKKIEELK